MSFSGTLLASAPQTANGNTVTVSGMPNIIGALFIVSITALSGTAPTLDMKLQVYDPGSDSYVDLANFPQMNATGKYKAIVFPNAAGALYQVLPASYRLAYIIGGSDTPTVTFSISVNYL